MVVITIERAEIAVARVVLSMGGRGRTTGAVVLGNCFSNIFMGKEAGLGNVINLLK